MQQENQSIIRKIQDDYHKLDRSMQVILIRVRTGHNRLNDPMNKKIKCIPSSMCIFNIDKDQTTENILQRCLNHTNINYGQTTPLCNRNVMELKIEELRRTVSFIRQSNLSM